MIASASPADYERTIRAVVASGEVDAVIVIFIPPLATAPEEVAAAIGRAGDVAVPVLGVFMGGGLHPAGASVPVFAYPEDAARALARAARWSEWRARPVEPAWRAPDVRQDHARAVVARALGRGDGWLGPAEVEALLACYGFRPVESRLAATRAEAAAAADDPGGQVAVKAYGAGLLHKSEAGAVALAEDLPELAEVDLNPVIVGSDGAAVVDARTRVEARDPRPPEGSRPRPRGAS